MAPKAHTHSSNTPSEKRFLFIFHGSLMCCTDGMFFVCIAYSTVQLQQTAYCEVNLGGIKGSRRVQQTGRRHRKRTKLPRQPLPSSPRFAVTDILPFLPPMYDEYENSQNVRQESDKPTLRALLLHASIFSSSSSFQGCIFHAGKGDAYLIRIKLVGQLGVARWNLQIIKFPPPPSAIVPVLLCILATIARVYVQNYKKYSYATTVEHDFSLHPILCTMYTVGLKNVGNKSLLLICLTYPPSSSSFFIFTKD